MEEDFDTEDTGSSAESVHSTLENEKKLAHLQPWQYKKGQSGNPSGRPAGKSLKQYTIEKLNSMTDEEREEFLNGIDKKTIWEMGEGKAKQDTDLNVGGDIIPMLVKFIENGKDSNS